MTRLDASLLFAAISAARFLWAWQERRLRRELPLLVVYVVATFVLLVPYFWFNFAVFGSFGPSSGTALAYLHSYAGAYALSNILQPFFLNSAFAAEWVPSIAIMAVAVSGTHRRDRAGATPCAMGSVAAAAVRATSGGVLRLSDATKPAALFRRVGR